MTTLSRTSFETLFDLLDLRIDAFIVTNNREAAELRDLKACRKELQQMRDKARTNYARLIAAAAKAAGIASASRSLAHIPTPALCNKLPRRLRREIRLIRDKIAS